MTRTQRLLTLLQILKENRYPITAEALADKLHISVRSIYRDIESLRNQGAEITAEAGIGYQLKSGLLLPPLTFDINELEALILGLRWVENNTDQELSHSALRAINKINAVITAQHQRLLEKNTLFVPIHRIIEINHAIAKDLRLSLREEKKAQIDYQDAKKQLSRRIIWPIAVGYFQDSQVIAAWCELRKNYRHFRLDRIISYEILNDTLPYPKNYLLDRWKKEILKNTPDNN
ncbi:MULTISPECIES: helix-turn-helix transcriptional regulator [Proteus]|jgi:predicted DNA-binding transcriptional regulator YafY|uniref:Bifunctional biotin--[acetyl-CoA-carboxylase] synthetase/biotin operon repressor n=1 Tax=Proteus vulgaris TaxID=585 RepID=A0A379FD30_PROVU|nr:MULTISPECIES: YafY family protein [Proteus]NBN60544.1 HTH domain-containing protein [Proteus sp. G2639]RNT28777.1 YafY family transcriptional regulator [Proteus mirabilis]AYY80992.1 YafY family transcriptional regulator [Proteus vulgaris]KGA59103.1 HTH domain protein [Proteus vulgaris]MBG5971865.1 YafY family transcriptional regulator [Proteus vulgaris]